MNRTLKRIEGLLLICCSLVLMAAAPAAPPASKPARSLEGRWQGEVVVTPGEYEVPLAIDVVRPASEPLKGSIDLPLRALKGLALKEVSLDGDLVYLVQPDKDGDYVFNGKLSEDGQVIEGTRGHSGDVYPFRLERVADPDRRPEIKPLAASAESLKAQFNADSAKTRLVVVLAPTCPTCRISAHLLEKYDLRAIADDRLRVYVVWQPVFPRDNREAVDDAAALLQDARVTHFWADDVAATAFYKSYLKLEHQVFDVAFLYPPGAKWDAAPPAPLSYMHRLESSGLPKENLFSATRLAEDIRKLLTGR